MPLARWRTAPPHMEHNPGRPMSWVGVGDRHRRVHHRRHRVLPRPALDDLLDRDGRRDRRLPLAPVHQDDERRLVLIVSSGGGPPGMSDPFARVMSVAESAGTVRYEHERPARGDLSLSADEVRRLTLYSQGFLGAAAKRGGVTGVLRRIGAVQLDTISVLARSHELVAYARLGPVGRDAVEAAVLARPTASRRRSSTGRTPPASCRSRTGPTTPGGDGPSPPAASAGTRSASGPATRSSRGCATRGR